MKLADKKNKQQDCIIDLISLFWFETQIKTSKKIDGSTNYKTSEPKGKEGRLRPQWYVSPAVGSLSVSAYETHILNFTASHLFLLSGSKIHLITARAGCR